MEYTEIQTDSTPEKAVLICVDTGDFDAEASVKELEELAKTAGAEVLAAIIQRREAPSPSSYIGPGRLAELVDFCNSMMWTSLLRTANFLLFRSEILRMHAVCALLTELR